MKPELHPEQGPVWQWIHDHDREVYGCFTPVYQREGAGALRRLDAESLDEIHRIFDESGGTEMFETIERHSDRKAREMGYEQGADERYMMDVFRKTAQNTFSDMKRNSWQEYQKQIADDRYYYARSCIRQNFFRAASGRSSTS